MEENLEAVLELQMRKDIQSRQVGMDTALFDPNTSEVHVLNASASAILSHVTPKRTVQEIALNMSLGFSEIRDLGAIQRDVVWIISELKRHKVLEKPVKMAKDDKSQAVLTEFAMSEVPCAYFRPAISTYTLSELQDMFNSGRGGTARFGDTWNPSTGAP